MESLYNILHIYSFNFTHFLRLNMLFCLIFKFQKHATEIRPQQGSNRARL